MTADARWIAEADVVSVLDLAGTREALRQVLTQADDGRATTMEKTHVAWGDGHTLHAIGGEASGAGLVGTKTWAHTAGGAEPLLVLWDADTGQLRAVIEAFALGQLRTAAVSSLATDLLAQPDARTMAIIGTGKQAMPQVAAVTSVRPITTVRVFSPTAEHREHFAEQLRRADAAKDVVACATVAEAVAGVEVVTTATRARQPFLRAADLSAGAHVNAMGAITSERLELHPDVVATAGIVVADSPDAATRLSSELPPQTPVEALSAVVSGRISRPPGRSLFKSMGIGLADLAVGAAMLDAADPQVGTPIPVRRRVQPQLFGGAR